MVMGAIGGGNGGGGVWIQGPPGPMGPAGPQGPQRPQGLPGPADLSGSVLGVFVPNNRIGGAIAAARNVLAGMECRENAGGNVIQGNFINVNFDGTTAFANQLAIKIYRSSNNIVGGTLAGARNIVARAGGSRCR